uniref:hypothetical protein n=1 Tax=Treponema sp. TaxID=166 RepID=UPI0038904C29
DFEKIFLTVNENESSILTAKFEEKQNYNIFKKSNEITYNPLRYYSRGVYLPFLGTVPVYSHDFEQNSTAILGFTFLSTNPWGDRQINFSAGYDPVYQNGGMNLGFSGGNDSFQYALSGTCIFDKDGFMQSADSLSFTKYLWRGKVSYFAFGTEGKFLYGRQIIDELFEDNVDDSTGKSADGIAFLQFSNVHKISPEVYNSLGFVFQPFLLSSYRDSENLIDDDKYLNTGCSLTLRFPVIIPFIVKGSFFPSSKYCAAGSVTAILADFEIHKGIPAVSLFMQRVVVSATYSGKISYQHGEFWDVRHTDTIFKNIEKSDYSDVIQAGADLYLSPNTGFLANDSIQFSVGYTFIFRPHPKEDESKFVYGIAVGANY